MGFCKHNRAGRAGSWQLRAGDWSSMQEGKRARRRHDHRDQSSRGAGGISKPFSAGSRSHSRERRGTMEGRSVAGLDMRRQEAVVLGATRKAGKKRDGKWMEVRVCRRDASLLAHFRNVNKRPELAGVGPLRRSPANSRRPGGYLLPRRWSLVLVLWIGTRGSWIWQVDVPNMPPINTPARIRPLLVGRCVHPWNIDAV